MQALIALLLLGYADTHSSEASHIFSYQMDPVPARSMVDSWQDDYGRFLLTNNEWLVTIFFLNRLGFIGRHQSIWKNVIFYLRIINS